MQREQSKTLFEEAQRYLPGGVDSPVRAFRAVGGDPPFIERGEGAYLYDADGNQYIDYVCSYGPLILGHAHPQVVEALQDAAERGTSYGAPTKLETQLAGMMIDATPSIETVRFVNSGTEATMTALRLARAYTGRDKIVKFQGCYHGHADMLLVQAGSGVATLGLPDSPGVPKGAVGDTLAAPFNDLDAVRALFEEYEDEIAAVILEPIAGNMGVIPPRSGYLKGLRELTEAHDALLIFDEVITGFRVCWGGAQELYDVTPDITTLGKIIGGGLPVGAYGGRREIMETVAPLGPMYQAGTLSGNPLAMTAGLETLKALREPGSYARLESLSAQLADGLGDAAAQAEVPVHQTRLGSMQSLFFTDQEVINYETAQLSDTDRFAKYFHAMLDSGVYLGPSQFESTFVSLAHTEEDIERTVEAAKAAMKSIAA